ncbi:hypothetical protein [Methylophilus sp. Leaf408]|uniref:hypothetical protein n=1 Tax=Methylophilus sp. Leaf408 TaxID=2876561 RepID=UPI001E62C455|nr:hypothetical protein [Methylophilus sp. Leaf408]
MSLLSDKTGDILKGIFKDFCSVKGIKNLLIVPSYDLDSDFTQYAENRKALLDELIKGVDPKQQPSQLTSTVISGLSYSFAWSAGVYFGESAYSPIEHALQHHELLFGHAKKFSRDEHSVIVFVIFPWSGEKVFSFEGTKRTFFKQLGDHFFNDYLGSADLASKYNRKFKSSILAANVTRYLSGIVYLEDKAITANTPDQLNIEASYRWNENAINPLFGTLFDNRLNLHGAFNLNTYIAES